jgi:hypothetical protein
MQSTKGGPGLLFWSVLTLNIAAGTVDNAPTFRQADCNFLANGSLASCVLRLLRLMLALEDLCVALLFSSQREIFFQQKVDWRLKFQRPTKSLLSSASLIRLIQCQPS